MGCTTYCFFTTLVFFISAFIGVSKNIHSLIHSIILSTILVVTISAINIIHGRPEPGKNHDKIYYYRNYIRRIVLQSMGIVDNYSLWCVSEYCLYASHYSGICHGCCGCSPDKQQTVATIKNGYASN